MGCTSTTVTLLVFNGLFVSAEKTLATSRALTKKSRHKFLLTVYLLALEGFSPWWVHYFMFSSLCGRVHYS